MAETYIALEPHNKTKFHDLERGDFFLFKDHVWMKVNESEAFGFDNHWETLKFHGTDLVEPKTANISLV